MDGKQKTGNSYSLLRKLDENNSAPKKKTSDSSKKYNEGSSSRHESGSSRSSVREKKYKKRLPKEEIDFNIPDTSYGDMYCKVCDAHMNSDLMWKAHIQGKRHLKNIKKECPEKKYFDIDEDSELQEEIDKIREPVVGLDYVHEIQKCDSEIPLFQCFLCNANLPSGEVVIEHLLGLKHRMAYLNKHNHEQFELLEKAQFKKNLLEPLVEEQIAKLEKKLGRGKISVKLAKPKGADPFKRPAVEEDRNSPKRTRNDSAILGTWKPLDSEVRHDQMYYPHPPEEKQLYFPKYPEKERVPPPDVSRYEVIKPNVGKTNNASHSSERKCDIIPWLADVERLIQSCRNNPYSSSYQKKIDQNEQEVANFLQHVNERSSRTLRECSYSGDSPKIDYEKTKKETSPVAEFLKALYSLPPIEFFNIVKTKLETMSLETNEELKALVKLSELIQTIILSRKLNELGPDAPKNMSELLKSDPKTPVPGWKDILNKIQINNSTSLQSNTLSAYQDISNFSRSVGCVGDGRYSQSTLISPKTPPYTPPETSGSYSLFGSSSYTSIPGLSLSEDHSSVSSDFATATRRSVVNEPSSETHSHFQGLNSFLSGKYWN